MARIAIFLAGLLIAPLSPVWASPTPAKAVSLALDDAPVNQVLAALAAQQQFNLVVAPGISGAISIQLQDVPWRQAMDTVAQLAKLSWRLEGNILKAYPQQWEQQQAQLKDQARQRRLAAAPLDYQAFTVRYADAEELAQQLAQSKLPGRSPQGSVVADKRTNRLLIRDTPQALAALQRWVSELDVPLAQVELAAHIVTMSQESLNALGVRWGSGGESQGEAGARLWRPSAVSAGQPIAGASVDVGFNIGTVNGRLLEVALAALEQKHQLEIIASPRLMASHRQPASIKQGSEIPYQVSSGKNGGTSVEFKEAVLGMEVTPVILADNRVQLQLKITQNMPGQKLKQAEGEALAIDKQEIETQVVLRAGETLALGGIFQQQAKRQRNGVPGLSSVPLLGGLFRYQDKSERRHQLVVFITPRLIEGR